MISETKKLDNPKRLHRYHSGARRGILSFLLVTVVMIMGTFGMHHIEKLSYLDAFYFMSMIATAQGPTIAPVTATGKIFASLMAFVSVGAVVAALGFLFGPFFGKLCKIGFEKLEQELHLINKNKDS